MSSTQQQPPAGPIAVTAGEGERVPVHDINEQLKQLWLNVSQQVHDESGFVPLRTSILNLIVIAQTATDLRTANETLQALAEQLPSRAIVLRVDKEGTPFDASISASCRMLNNGRATCYEIIEIRAPMDQLVAVPNLLEPLLLYDVPTLMWWVGDPEFSTPEFMRISQVADRLIVDSSRFDEILEAMAAFEAFLNNHENVCTGTDLNWGRGEAWRELIAQSFDHPQTVGLLPHILQVEFSFDPSAKGQAMLLEGWLASRLGWRLTDVAQNNNEITLEHQSVHGPVTVLLSDTGATGVGLRSVRILSRVGTHSARVVIRRTAANVAAASIEIAGQPRQERVVRDRPPNLAELLGKEMMIHIRDEIFDRTLDHVAAVVQQIREDT